MAADAKKGEGFLSPTLFNPFKRKIRIMKQKKNPRDYKVNGKQYAYILDSINPDNYGVDADGMSDKEKVEFLLETFNKERNYTQEKIRIPYIVNRFEDWMRGLPSVFSISFDPCHIIEIGKSWGYCQTEKKSNAFVENWWHAIAAKVFQLANILGVDYEK